MKAVILCGGLATRMGSACSQIPKAMLKICGKPVLQYQIEALKKEGISEFILVAGHLHGKIQEYFADGKSFGVSISYFIEDTPLGTAGALPKLGLTDDFILCGGDLIFDFCLKPLYDFHKHKGALITVLTHPNSHPHDSTLIIANENGKVISCIDKNCCRNDCRNLCNAGIQLVSPRLLELFPLDGKANFDSDLLIPAIDLGLVYSYKTVEYIKDMGTPERFATVEKDIKNELPEKQYMLHSKKAVFLDRDGTINKHLGSDITNPDDIELIDGIATAINRFHQLGYLVIIITNQPAIAKGKCTFSMLEKIHGRLETLLGKEQAFVDGIYFCPHHPKSGFEGEIKELKINCSCRKPKPGMLLSAKKDFNINLEQSFMIGDKETDVEAAVNAGCIPVYLSETQHCRDILTFKSVYEFSNYIINKDE